MLGRGLMVVAVVLLMAVMSASFLNVPWPSPPPECGGELCEIEVTDPRPPAPPVPEEESLTKSLFGPYVFLVILSALVLAACMIGGVYLAKMEGGGPPP
jgi:NADH:ubiquinone oxidoreductase subunit 6 (subunit J)